MRVSSFPSHDPSYGGFDDEQLKQVRGYDFVESYCASIDEKIKEMLTVHFVFTIGWSHWKRRYSHHYQKIILMTPCENASTGLDIIQKYTGGNTVVQTVTVEFEYIS